MVIYYLPEILLYIIVGFLFWVFKLCYFWKEIKYFMSLFQKSVISKYTADLDKGTVTLAYAKYKEYFHNREIQENIINAKEEQFQEGFLTELFCKILGYTINPNPSWA